MHAPPSNPALLVVEDNPHTRRLVHYWLHQQYALTLVPDARKALQVATEETFDLFLLDINLGQGINGVELLKVLRRMPTYAATPAVAFTVLGLPGERRRFMEQGFDGFLSKPFTKEQIHDTLGVALGTPHVELPERPAEPPLFVPLRALDRPPQRLQRHAHIHRLHAR